MHIDGYLGLSSFFSIGSVDEKPCAEVMNEYRQRGVIQTQATRCARPGSGLGLCWFLEFHKLEITVPASFFVHRPQLIGGLEHDWVMTFHRLGMSSSQLTNSIIFQRDRYTSNQLFHGWMMLDVIFVVLFGTGWHPPGLLNRPLVFVPGRRCCSSFGTLWRFRRTVKCASTGKSNGTPGFQLYSKNAKVHKITRKKVYYPYILLGIYSSISFGVAIRSQNHVLPDVTGIKSELGIRI